MVQFVDDAPEFIIIKRSKGVIVMVSHKGGCGKTAFSFILASYLFERLHEKILLMDFDQQGTLGQRLNKDGEDNEIAKGHRLSELFSEFSKSNISSGVVPLVALEDKNYGDAGIHILLGDSALKDAVERTEEAIGSQELLKKFVEKIDKYEQNYDRIIIDTTPIMDKSKGCLYALNVADSAVVTLSELESIEQFETTVTTIVREGKKYPKIVPLYTMYSKDLAGFAAKFDAECKKRKIRDCGKFVTAKCKQAGFGHDERRSTLYRIFRTILPKNTCVVGIPWNKDIQSHRYLGANRENKKILNAACEEVLQKVSGNTKIENLCDNRVLIRTLTSLKRYLDIWHYIDTKGLDIKNYKAVIKTNIRQKKKEQFDIDAVNRRAQLERDAFRNR